MNNSISVLLPVKNAASTLLETLQSCLIQSHTKFELLIINDHCTDNSFNLIKQIADPRINLIENQGDGLVDALNTGLRKAQFDLIARMDADDIMHPQRLAKQAAYLIKHPEIDVLGCRVNLFPAESIQGGFAYFIEWQNALLSHTQIQQQLFVETPLTHPSVMFRKKVVQTAGGYRKGDFPEDYELWLRLSQLGYRFAKLSETLLDWRESPTRLSRTANNCRREAFDALRADYLQYHIDPNRSLYICGAGRRTRQRCQFLLDKGFKVSAWIDADPNKIGHSIDQVPVIAINQLPKLSQDGFILNYISQRGARAKVEKALVSLGYRAGIDFLSVG